MRFLTFLPPLAVLLLTPCVGVHAFERFDPLQTEAISPAPPLLKPGQDAAFTPCQLPPADAAYDALQVVDLALCQNPKTREAWASARSQAAMVGVAQGAYLPTLDSKLASNQTRSSGDSTTQNSASLTFSWLLVDFGARSATLENARQLLEAAAMTLDATVQTLFLSALQGYYNAQAARAAVTAAMESEKASRESLTAAETRYQVGTGTPADRLQAQTAWSQATLNRIKAEGTLKNALGTLANLMGLDANQPLRLAEIPDTLPDTRFDQQIESLISEARERRPDLKAAEAQLKAAQANVDIARASGLPRLSLAAGPSWQETRGSSNDLSKTSNAIGLTLTIPIFSGFDTTYKLRSAQARVETASAQRETLRLQVALEVWNAWQNLQTATQTIRTTADLLASAEQSERVALGRYKAGVGNILDVLNAHSALAAARLQRIQALLDWRISRATLAKAVGRVEAVRSDATNHQPLTTSPKP